MSVENKVRKIISEQLKCHVDRVVSHANLVDDMGADSLGLIELTMELEDKFELDIPFEDAERLHTVRDVIDYVETYC